MTKDTVVPFRIFVVGVCADIVALVLYWNWVRLDDSMWSFGGKLQLAKGTFLFFVALGPFCTFLGGAVWASRAQWGHVIAALFIIALLLLLFSPFIRSGVHDPLYAVYPFCLLIGLTLIVARAFPQRR